MTVEEGQSASFIAGATGVPTPTVQWQVSSNAGSTWSAVAGAQSSMLTIASATTSESGDEFRAVYSNALGEAASKAATLTVQKAPAVVSQPQNATVEEGASAEFEATASGYPAPAVKWEQSSNGGASWTAIAGATSPQLTVASTKASQSGLEYRATFKNVAGSAVSQAAQLTVQKMPAITRQPIGPSVEEGQPATLEATASGFPIPTVQWELSSDGGSTWSAVPGATSDQLTIAGTVVSENGDKYRAVFANAAGSIASQVATLTVGAPPLVTEQPRSMIVEVGENAVFQATASGFPTPTEQWEVSANSGSTWTAVAGATGDQLTIESAQVASSGQEYRATFLSTSGKASTSAATLTVATNHFSAVAWGDNIYRELGDGFAEQFSDVPVPVSGLKFVTAVAAGSRHGLALLASGEVLAWGSNGFGQLGDNSHLESSVPVPVQGLGDVTAIAAGASHSLALLSNGTVMAWGDNESGQLGVGNASEDSQLPVAVKGLTNVKAIAAGADFSLALLSNGTVMAWGDNESGQLGTGTTTSSNAPVVVKSLSGVSAIAAGGEFSLALLSSGAVRAWGSDEQAQLGNTTVEEGSSDTPVPVEGLTGASSIAAGDDHALALLSGGTVMAWGSDSAGELGDGAIAATAPTPVAVSGLSGVKAISAGDQTSAALLNSGNVMTWGTGSSGVLGDGIAGAGSDVPVAVVGLASVASISAGRLDMLAFGEPLPVVTGLSPSVGPAGGGATVTISGDTFTGATAVKFGATPASSFTVNSASSITATAPRGTGVVDVTVTAPGGTSAARSADRYTYQLAPTVTKLSTKTGPVSGGSTVTITGTELTAAANVSFGGTPATEFKVNSATSITAVTPASAAGATEVTVTNTAGTSPTSSKTVFDYLPTVGDVSPNDGPETGGTTVTVTGAGFALGATATTFKFGTTKAKAVNCTSSSSCTMTAPAHTVGAIEVVATVAKMSSTANAPADQFTYN